MTTHHVILIVDDEPYVLSALRRLLVEDEDFVTVTADGAAEAVSILESRRVDVIISDQDMPGMSGMRLLDEAARVQPDAVRMILSGKADLRLATEAVNQQRIYRYLLKPWEDDEIKLMIRLALGHRADRERVRELSRLIQLQADLFAQVLARHPDCEDLVAAYIQGGGEPPCEGEAGAASASGRRGRLALDAESRERPEEVA